MTFFESVRDAMLAGFGMQLKLQEFVEELIKKGELSESQGAKIVKEWTDKAGKGAEDLSKTFSDLMAKGLEKMNIPTKDDIEAVNKKIHQLSNRIKKLEDAEK
ncbi:MAG: phasin family protein [Nitrospiraceae bacterium]|nr:phasin family protein [Nitrospiraceae bacterium]